MNRWLITGCILLLLSQSSPGAASVQFLGIVGRVQADSGLPAVFGNQESKINLQIDGSFPTNASLRADEFLVAGNLAMPLAKNILLKDVMQLTNSTSQQIQISLKFPDVKRRSEILIRLSLLKNGIQSTSIPLGDLHFEVFPPSVTKELTDLMLPGSDGTPAVTVFGSGQKLRAFLADVHISFTDGGINTRDRFDVNHLYFAELEGPDQVQQVMDRSVGTRLAVFAADESLPPGIYSTSAQGTQVRVTLPLLDNLRADPRAQIALTKVVHLLLSSPQASTPYTP